MDPAQFFATFRKLHDQARTGGLDASDRTKYQSMCEEFARSLMKAQGQEVAAGRPARRQLKVAHLFPIEVANLYSTMTREVSCAGFTVLVPGSLRDGDQVSFSLKPTRSAEPVSGNARITAVSKVPGGNFRVTCAFETLDEARLQRLEHAVFEAALARVG